MVLDELFARSRERAARLPALGRAAPTRARRASFKDAIAGKDHISLIAEFKRRSPSLGAIAPEADLEATVSAYQAAGAAALSVLTEPSRFGGSSDDLARAARATALPILRKDFIIDARQLEEAAALGASSALLIARSLDDAELAALVEACRERALVPLIECHDEAELERAMAFDDAIIGVNNRDLDTLHIDIARAPRLLARVPKARVTVAESGYTDPAELATLFGLCDAVLIGSALMAKGDAAAFVAAARGEVAR